ncbi:nucleoside deaminase [Clostridium sp. FAM 1755]|uniref:nucleoside deaminase n=1 Tax=Clostridium caseinilyticum TaxID=3350403 RepID=UPI002A62A4CC|nr:nucleoside deaminase [Clostridium botulinum]
MDKNKIMDLCVKSCIEGMKNHEGGPFGAVIVKGGQVIAVSHNTVIRDNDPTAHGEVNAIRQACKKLNTFDLRGCELYTTSEPCPMCMSAIIWANISKVYYGCTIEDAKNIGFRDDHILRFLQDGCKDKNVINLEAVSKESCLKAFEYWSKAKDKVEY